MRQAAARAPNRLGEATGQVVGFLAARLTAAGGFADRAGQPDLYYTVFGVEGLAALGAAAPADRVAAFLRTVAQRRAPVDLVRAACLARCWAGLADGQSAERIDPPTRRELLDRLEAFRCPDGGYGPSGQGTAYGCFLALGACQDLGEPPANPRGVLECLAGLKSGDGGYANEPDRPFGLTPATAAALVVQADLGGPTDAAAADWLLDRCRPDGGFGVMAGLGRSGPAPDLLSTATALHALARVGAEIGPRAGACIDFILGLRSPSGGFVGQPDDPTPDCEYTFYALLALGHLGA